jgi:hypothetical protein
MQTSRRRAADSPQPTGVELGPIGLTFNTQVSSSEGLDAEQQQPKLESIHSMTTAEWRAKYEKDGTVDLWVEEEFNAGSRLVVRDGLLWTLALTSTFSSHVQPQDWAATAFMLCRHSRRSSIFKAGTVLDMVGQSQMAFTVFS